MRNQSELEERVKTFKNKEEIAQEKKRQYEKERQH